MSTWEERMAARAAARREVTEQAPGIPFVLNGWLPSGEPDVARHWCTSCGLPDPPQKPDWYGPGLPCPRCGSTWQWYGRIADRDGTAAGPPGDGACRLCCEWRRYPAGQEHFGWGWWMTCSHLGLPEPRCQHECHIGEVWFA